MQAAIGVSQIDKLDRFIHQRNANFEGLTRRIKAAGLEEFIHLPQATPGATPSWFGYLMTLRDGCGLDRTKIVRALEERQVGTRLLFGGNLLRQPAFMGCQTRTSGGLENTDKVMKDSFWIGVWPGINNEMLDYMVETLSSVLKEKHA